MTGRIVREIYEIKYIVTLKSQIRFMGDFNQENA
jgi:hypothetical protein